MANVVGATVAGTDEAVGAMRGAANDSPGIEVGKVIAGLFYAVTLIPPEVDSVPAGRKSHFHYR